MTFKLPTAAAIALSVAAVTLAVAQTTAPSSTDAQKPPQEPNAQMQAVLDELAALHPKPIAELTAEQAREQPTPTDAVKKLMEKKGMNPVPQDGVGIEPRTIPGADGMLEARVYTPPGGAENRPLIVYFRGGGWVIATLDTYEASARSLAAKTGAVVLSVNYRQAPEHTFPAAHEDAYTAFQWAVDHAGELNANPEKVAIAGESAGGNMAASVCLMARDRGGKMPVHQLLVYPVANTTNDDASTLRYADAKPLNKAMMAWFTEKYAPKQEDLSSPYLNILSAQGDLKALPPATVITAEIDPLQTEGREYAMKLKEAGVDVRYQNFPGVTHEFFGMAAVIDEAKKAQALATERLKASLK